MQRRNKMWRGGGGGGGHERRTLSGEQRVRLRQRSTVNLGKSGGRGRGGGEEVAGARAGQAGYLRLC